MVRVLSQARPDITVKTKHDRGSSSAEDSRESRNSRDSRDSHASARKPTTVSLRFQSSRRREVCPLPAPTTMAFRVDRSIEGELAILRVSGRLTAESPEILRAAVEQESGAVVIDLRDVGLIDRKAVRYLAAIEAHGGALRNCPAFIREWVNRERAQTRRTSRTREDEQRGDGDER